MLLILSLCLVHDCMLFLFCPRGPASKARSVSVCRLICRRVVTSLLTWTSSSPMSLSTFWSYWWPLLLNRMHSVGVCDLSDSCPEGNSHRKRATLHDLTLTVVHKTVFQYEKRNMHWYFIYLFISAYTWITSLNVCVVELYLFNRFNHNRASMFPVESLPFFLNVLV